jgi:hypothetical protein
VSGIDSAQDWHRNIGHTYGGTEAEDPTLKWRHPLLFPLRQTEPSKAQLWLRVTPKFSSHQSRGIPVVVVLDPHGCSFQSSQSFLGQCAGFRYWGNP